MDDPFEQHEEIPADLSRRMRAAHAAGRAMPDPAPAAALWAAGRRRRQMRRVALAGAAGAPLAAAAAVAIVVWSGPLGSTRGRSPASHSTPIVAAPDAAAARAPAGDIDASGRIDMLDALQLALAVEGGAGGRDVDGDGQVDERDVEALAAAAVSLDQESTL